MMNALDEFLSLADSSRDLDKDLIDQARDLQMKIILAHRDQVSKLYPQGLDLRSRIGNLSGEARVKWFQNWSWTDDDIEVIKNIFKGHIDWQHPCLEIFPGTGQCLSHALGAEPLYIADWNDDVLENAAAQFNDYYATKRLMKYKIQGFDLSPLPQGSFAFVYAVNYLRFEDRTGLNNLAKSVWDLLLPGGHYLFAFSPTDLKDSMLSIESGYAFGADSSEVKKDLLDIGFIVEEMRRETPYLCLCKKPGDLVQNKMTSILAKIIDRE